MLSTLWLTLAVLSPVSGSPWVSYGPYKVCYELPDEIVRIHAPHGERELRFRSNGDGQCLPSYCRSTGVLVVATSGAVRAVSPTGKVLWGQHLDHMTVPNYLATCGKFALFDNGIPTIGVQAPDESDAERIRVTDRVFRILVRSTPTGRLIRSYPERLFGDPLIGLPGRKVLTLAPASKRDDLGKGHPNRYLLCVKDPLSTRSLGAWEIPRLLVKPHRQYDIYRTLLYELSSSRAIRRRSEGRTLAVSFVEVRELRDFDLREKHRGFRCTLRFSVGGPMTIRIASPFKRTLVVRPYRRSGHRSIGRRQA